jgi:hypothetical protein
MRDQKTLILAAAGAVAVLAGCLQSPLFRHVNADELRRRDDARGSKPPACAFHFPKAALCASLEWIVKPSHDEKAEFRLRFWHERDGTEHGPYVDPPHAVAAKLWMPAMGHGSSPVRVGQEKDASLVPIPGVYLATDVFFMMDGEWEIWVQLKREREIVEQAKVDYDFH